MTKAKFNQLKNLGIAALGAYVISGCPSSNAVSNANSGALATGAATDGSVESTLVQTSAQADVNQADVTQADASQPVDSTVNIVSTSELDFEVCAAVDDWQRPTEDEQAKHLNEDARYGAALEADDALKRASTQFWDHEAVSFTTYGLSARMEPVMLSGLWTVADELWGCYEPEATVAINEGDRAETWLLNQRITNLAWDNDRYVMTVEPAATGVQVIQFDRVDELVSLPLEIVTSAGTSVPVTSGDWQ
ncbi:MAG: hypothetical protein AAFR58_00990 [Cyanobacteria bacterium J06627_28]